VVVEEIWDPPPAFPDPIDEPLPGGPDDPGSIPTIPPDDPDDGDGGGPIRTPDPVPVSKNELEDLYERECGYTNELTLGKAFEVDARYALGHSAPGGFEFPDESKPDGVKRGVLIDGSPDYSYFRGLLEAKYKESGLLEGSQTRKYIDELARPYVELPGYETTWPPFLVIASLSTNSELRYFDDGGATLRHAEENGINVFHVTLQRDANGQLHLKGRKVGMVTVQRNSDGSLVQRRASDTITESYEFTILCKAHEAQSN